MAAVVNSLLILLSGLAGLACVGWVIWRWYQGSDDRPALLVRWGISLLDLLFLLFLVGPTVAAGGLMGAFAGVPMAAVAGLILAVVWVSPITRALGRRVGSLYDGGRTPADREPMLSMVEARRKQGRYAEAARLLREQLLEFPRHFTGQMLLAEILADDLHDLAGAGAVVEEILSQEHHAPRNLAYALTRLADWQLKHARDVGAARVCFERIIELLPDTPEAHRAQQRLARLTGTEQLLRRKGPRRVEAPRADPHLGVRKSPAFPPPPTAPSSGERMSALIRQLEQSPHDNQAREELANLYAEECDRPDLAVEQFEQLIAQPHAPEREVARWHHRLADLHLRFPGGESEARRALEALIARYPDSPVAEVARRRLPLLPCEARKTAAGPTVRLGPPSKPSAPPPATGTPAA